MKRKFISKLAIFMMSGVLISSMITPTIAVYAVEGDKAITSEDEQTNKENAETTKTNTQEDTKTDEVGAAPSEDAIGDEVSIIQHMDVHKKTETNKAQVTGYFIIPFGFGHNAYVQVMDKNGQIYQITTSDENGYSDYAFLPYGTYTVISYGIVRDTGMQYPLTLQSEDTFTLSEENNMTTIKMKIDAYDDIALAVSQRSGKDIQKAPDDDGSKLSKTDMYSKFGEEVVYPTYFKDAYINTSGELYYDFKTDAEFGTLFATGNATHDYNVVITIIEEGVLGEAKFSISTDGGKTILGKDFVSDAYKIEGVGLTFHFGLDDEQLFKVGEKFTCQIPKTFNMYGAYKEGNFVIKGEPTQNYNFELVFLSDGGRGKAKFQIITNNDDNTKIVATIPEDGIYEYKEFTFYFTDQDFQKGLKYNLNYKYADTTPNYIPLYILIILIVCAGFAFYVYLATKKEKPIDYKLQSWKDKQSDETYD